jgi:hypothetical protein
MKSIPLIDVRGKSNLTLVHENPQAAKAMIQSLTHAYGWMSRAAAAVALPVLDKRSHRWLIANRNPYLKEIDAIADAIGIRGAYTFNVCYQWACTTGVFATEPTPSLLRILDWGFPNLGANVTVQQRDTEHGDWFNVTWPGYVGSVNGMAPGRFAAAINIAPERKQAFTRVGDWLKNKRVIGSQRGLPPDHLLRYVFENARDYKDAFEMLSTMPILAPVIYTLCGTEPGQGVVIDRVETRSAYRKLGSSQSVTTANHFLSSLGGEGQWRSRGVDSFSRYRQSCGIDPTSLSADNFEWLSDPIINWETRLAILANPTTGRLMVQGLEGDVRNTEVFHLPASALEKK